jgi:hypothetical protein
MKLTIINRLKLCWEILTFKGNVDYPVYEKELPIFIRGYQAGVKDEKLDHLK